MKRNSDEYRINAHYLLKLPTLWTPSYFCAIALRRHGV